MAETAKILRRASACEKAEINRDERTIVAEVTTAAVDRDREVVLPSGAQLENYRKNPVVLWAHDYRGLPIGKNLWIKPSSNGLLAKTQFARHEEANKIFEAYADGVLRGWSIGFIPLEESPPEPDEIKATPEWASAENIVRKWELLEYSAVPVPANPEAIVEAEKMGIKIPDSYKIRASGADNVSEKTVIPYRRTPLAPEGAAWDAAAEVRRADTSDLKVMCAWYDSSNPDVKGSYKLPHHRADEQHTCVWRGVAAAMAALLGARGGVNIPASDRQGVYNHLKRHYKDFDKEPPELREYSEAELKRIERYGTPEPRVLIVVPPRRRIVSVVQTVDERIEELARASVARAVGRV